MQLSPLSAAIPSWGAPTLEGFDTSEVNEGQRIGGSARQMVRFYKKQEVIAQAVESVPDPATGIPRVTKRVPVTIEREMVEIVTPGDKNVHNDYAQDFHRREFFRHYKAFRDGRSAPIGTPIDECDFVSSSIATELRYLGVQTLEQLADASDILCNNTANGWELRDYARVICKSNLENQSLNKVSALQDELVKTRGLLDAQGKLIAEMQERMKASSLVTPSGEPVVLPEAPFKRKYTKKSKTESV